MKITITMKKRIASRTFLLLLFIGVMLVMFYHPLKELMELVLTSELYSYIILIPIIIGNLLRPDVSAIRWLH